MKTLIIDYEGVVLDPSHFMEQKSKNTAAVFKEEWSREFLSVWKNAFLHLTEGKMSLGEYYSKIAALLNKPVTGAEDTEYMKLETLRDAHLSDHLIALRRKYGPNLKIAVLANYPSRWVEHLLDAHNLSRHFAAVVCSDKIKVRRPDEEAFMAVLEKTGSRAADCIFVGHTVHDLDCAKAMGMTALYLGEIDGNASPYPTIATLMDCQKYIG